MNFLEVRLITGRIVWLAYLDCRLSRRLGRRLPLNQCINDPSIDEVLQACRDLGLKCEEDREARYPRAWYMSIGRVFVDTTMPKTRLLRLLAEKIRQIRRS